jgi:hypothetical protein
VTQIRTTPHIGDIVHYVSYGTPGGEYKSECRAAVVTEVYWTHTYDETGAKVGPSVPDEDRHASLAVLNPTGTFFNHAVAYDSGIFHPRELAGSPAPLITCRDLAFKGGTWHFIAAEP